MQNRLRPALVQVCKTENAGTRLNNSSPRISIYDLGLPWSVRKGTKASNQLTLEAEDCPRQSGGLRNRQTDGAGSSTEDKHLATRKGERL